MKKKWLIKDCDEVKAAELAEELRIHPLTARVLLNRGVLDAAAAESYFSPSLSDIPDPDELIDTKKAALRVAKAITDKEKIAIFGDYDVDGITGTALLIHFFKELSIDVTPFLPNRDDGYGLGTMHIERMKEQGITLLITVDNGIRAIDEIDYANDLGIDSIITDHHEPYDSLPKALAVLNPHRLKSDHPLWNLSGCGVAFMLLLGVRRHLRAAGLLPGEEPNLKRHLDLVALGTIADVMNLTGVNRTLVKFGLKEMSNSSKPGINALMQISASDPDDLSPGTISFRLAPRINAAGRMGNPDDALALLMTDTPHDAFDAAARLDKTNRERQSIEEVIIRSIDGVMSKDEMNKRSGIVLSSADWHIGVIGIVAAKVAERTSKPTIVITQDSNPARGSARSVDGVNLLEVLDECKDLLTGYGGHPMAAGVAIDKSKIEEFSDLFDKACSKQERSTSGKSFMYDAVAIPSDITEKLINEFEKCRPFGVGNPEPLVLMKDVNILEQRVVGNGHLKLTLGDSYSQIDAIAFGMADSVDDSMNQISVLCTPTFNYWNNMRTIQLKVKDIEPCSK